jgi:anti-anti-sigma regulatory factor
MSQKFQAAVQHRGDVSYVKLGGVIDEDNGLGELVEQIPNGTAVIDLGEIERINSCGVRDWVNWLSKLESNGTRSVLVECSPAIVAQINLVNNFTGSGVVKSFYVPYFCPECDEEKVLLVEAADMGPPPHEPPTCRCDECDLVMDFDDMPDSYFAFLSNQKKVAEPEKINGVIKEFAPSEGEKSKIRSRVGTTSVGEAGRPAGVPSCRRSPRALAGQPAGGDPRLARARSFDRRHRRQPRVSASADGQDQEVGAAQPAWAMADRAPVVAEWRGDLPYCRHSLAAIGVSELLRGQARPRSTTRPFLYPAAPSREGGADWSRGLRAARIRWRGAALAGLGLEHLLHLDDRLSVTLR